MFETPVTPYAGGHYNAHRALSHRTPRSSMHSSMDEETLNGVRLHRSHSTSADSNATVRDPHSGLEPADYFSMPSDSAVEGSVPSIMRTPASPSTTASELESEEQLYTPLSKRQRVFSVLSQIRHTLLPTFSNFGSQSVAAQIACVLAAPAVLCLTLTLPVVTTPYESSHSSREKAFNGDARLVDFEEEGTERVLIAEEEVEENLHQLQFNKWLMAVQSVVGPLFCVEVLFGMLNCMAGVNLLTLKSGGTRHALWIRLGTGLAGLVAATLIVLFCDKGNSSAARMARCSMGFMVAIVWIMAIADEVVNVLQVRVGILLCAIYSPLCRHLASSLAYPTLLLVSPSLPLVIHSPISLPT